MVEIKDMVSKPYNVMSWVLRDKDGNIIDSGKTLNQIQTAHATSLANQVDSTPAAAGGLYTKIAASDAGIPAASATDLAGNLLPAATYYTVTASTSAGAVVTTTYTFTAGQATGAILSVGLYTVGAGTLMCCASLVCTKGASDTLAVTWTVTFS